MLIINKHPQRNEKFNIETSIQQIFEVDRQMNARTEERNRQTSVEGVIKNKQMNI